MTPSTEKMNRDSVELLSTPPSPPSSSPVSLPSSLSSSETAVCEDSAAAVAGTATADAAATVIIHDPVSGTSYVRCTSTGPFVNPTAGTQQLTPEEVNSSLNLNLGQTVFNPNNKTVIWIIRFLNNFLMLDWWEQHFFNLIKSIPLKWRQRVIVAAWKVYLPLHRYFLGRRTGIHKAASEEYHALTTVMWWTRFIPITVERMRFALSQLTVWTNSPLSCRIEVIEEKVNLDGMEVPPDQLDHCTVRGLWIHVGDQPTESTLLWIYGGAFLSGDAQGNLGPAERIGKESGMDVFIPTHRLVPQVLLKDMLWDIALAYKWLCTRRRQEKTFVLGISSGAGLGLRLVQSIADTQRGEPTLPEFLSPLLNNVPMPSGAVLIGPFVDYTTPRGSLIHYAQHDLIVHQRVLESGLPFLETHMGGSRRDNSPVFRTFKGCPPFCVIVSEHEAVYDHAIDLINKARADGVPVTVGLWKYMCHVFSLLYSMIPEGEQSIQFVCQWLREQRQK